MKKKITNITALVVTILLLLTSGSQAITYQPICCVTYKGYILNTPITIMPLGDSITYGMGSTTNDGYRRPLYLKLKDAGYNADFVGSEQSGFGFNYDKDNEGHPAKTADYIRDNVYGYLQANPAKFVLLHVGTNDLIQNQGLSQTVNDVTGILDEIERYENDYNKEITVILALIINKVPIDGSTTQFNDSLLDMAYARIDNGDDIIVVDMEFDSGINYSLESQGGDIVDDALDVHPNDNGYAMMADVWFEGLSERLSHKFDTWTVRPTGVYGYKYFYGTAYGNNQYVTVGYGGDIMTSKDGTTWNQRYSGTSNSLYGVTYGNGLYVAVGSGGTILTSKDGAIWSRRVSGTNYGLLDVVYGNGTYVAVGYSGTILTSRDGILWTTKISGTTQALRSIAYGNHYFVAVGNYGTILRSFGYGYAWDNVSVKTTNILNGVAYGDGQFVAVGTGGAIYSLSIDARTWDHRTAGLDSGASGVDDWLYDVAYGNGSFVAVGANGTIVTSSTKLNWIERDPISSNYLIGVAFGQDRFMAVGGYGTILQSSPIIP